MLRHSSFNVLPDVQALQSSFLYCVCFVGYGPTLFASLPQALSSEFDEDVFEGRALQLDISKFDALLVNPLHQLDQRLGGPRGVDCQHLPISAKRGF